MEPLVDHFKQYYGYYAMGALCVLPVIILFRRYSVPTIMYAMELCIYMALLHCLTYGVVVFASWFKDQSTMKRARGLLGQDYNPGWKTPILEFWNRKQYDPQWLFYFEIVLLLVLVFLVWKYRPLRARRPKKAASKRKPLPYDYRKAK